VQEQITAIATQTTGILPASSAGGHRPSAFARGRSGLAPKAFGRCSPLYARGYGTAELRLVFAHGIRAKWSDARAACPERQDS